MFAWEHVQDSVRRVFTDRFGGVSMPPYDSLNLGGKVGDDPEHVRVNRSRTAHELGLGEESLIFMNQCHGSEVAVLDGTERTAPEVDAIVTTRPGVALAALVADCTPILLSDAEAGVIAAVHAGRLGMMRNVVGSAVGAMRDLGAQRIDGCVGPSVCPRCYEVPELMAAEAAAVTPEALSVSWTGTPAVDVAGAVLAQLRAHGVDRLTVVPGCSRESPSLFSHRRDQRTGRYAGIIVRQPEAA